MENEIEVHEEPIPEMMHNVFGLDHARILDRLLAARKRSKDAWSSLDEGVPVIHYRAAASKLPDVDMGTQKEDLADFLLKRQVNNVLSAITPYRIQCSARFSLESVFKICGIFEKSSGIEIILKLGWKSH